MKTPKEKKQITVIVVMLLATFAVIYFNFLKPKSVPAPTAVQSNTLPGSGTDLPAGTTGAVTAGSTSASVSAGSAFLPGGTNLNLNVLDDKHFKALVPPVYPVVTPDEIGSTNVFSEDENDQQQ